MINMPISKDLEALSDELEELMNAEKFGDNPRYLDVVKEMAFFVSAHVKTARKMEKQNDT